jgi:geranylgeranyl transferase type-2 subunit beta
LDNIDIQKAIEFLKGCQNFDGRFWCYTGYESHAGQVFVCIASFALAGMLDQIDKWSLGFWLSERQVSTGGFNGKPEKLPDFFYSWWVGSPKTVLEKQHWLMMKNLKN